MSAIMDEYAKDIIEETKKLIEHATQKTTLVKLFKNLPTLSVDDVKGSFIYLDEDEIKKVYDDVHGEKK